MKKYRIAARKKPFYLKKQTNVEKYIACNITQYIL